MFRFGPGVRRGGRLAAGALQQALPARSWRSATLWIIVLVNGTLIGLSCWSRGGAVTDLRIEVAGGHYEAAVDGKVIAEGELPARPGGGIGFRLRRNDYIPTLPSPVGIDSVRVTDAATGDVIFQDTFNGSRSDEWRVVWGDWEVGDGVLTTPSGGLITVGSDAWRDYVLAAKLRNVEDATVYTRMKDTGNAIELTIQPYRIYRSTLLVSENGAVRERRQASSVELDRGQTIQSIVAMLLRAYPTALMLIAGAITVAVGWRLAHRARLERQMASVGQSLLESSATLVLLLALWALVLLWYLNYVIGEHMPHVPDSVLYVFQAKIFASFHLTADAPPVRESFSIFRPHMDQVVDGRWFSHYPFGHPLFLAVGQLAGAVWLVPPIVGAASVMLIYWVGRHVYGAMVGLLAATLLLFSPFFQMTASNFMSHNTAAFAIVASLFLLVMPTRRRLVAMFFSGIFLGLLFNTRPLTAVAFIPALGALLAYELLRAGPDRLKILREDIAFSAGGLLMLGAYFLYNNATTGSFTESAYALQGTYSSDTFGFGGTHSVAFGLQNQRQLLSLLLLVANGWPLFVGLAFAALPFLLGTRHRWDYFLGAAVLAIAGVNIFYRNAAVMHGPRFWYETMPFLMLLTARGAQCLRDAAVVAGERIAVRVREGPPVPTTAVTGFAVIGLVLGLVAFSAYGWMLEQRDAWPGVPFTPQKISGLKGFNFTDRRLLDRADELDLKNALVLVEECSQWWCFGSVFWTNSPDLDGNIVWAERQHNGDDIELLESFEGRNLYLADYDQGSIDSITEAEIIAGAREDESQAREAPP